MCILYHVLLCPHSLPEWGILMSSGQQFLHIPYIIGIYSQFISSKFFSSNSLYGLPDPELHYRVSPFMSPNFRHRWASSVSTSSSSNLSGELSMYLPSSFFLFNPELLCLLFVLLYSENKFKCLK
jgi:hypothetical protein